ncbi:hypothetical protein [Amycolatopsis regifaucium]|uniref:Uncharacterized protein n=1 Tax=Amycolatopsis regifaucium TaxID=546365 RepID=A0A154MKU1_9PSEU|nr:hypothetical protein [Amycolatopsis regifaucium]KZB84497.1 hypothetical protein AVL48_32415 [Amycolatopsis regifaucium]OKA10959.1 hypothetical protein ATP06_0202080 [Amycolatopsis regifaucium]SFI23491.1 hypothetical protein SAMN04489731_109161 [Amycolatopsis regifaucium]
MHSNDAMLVGVLAEVAYRREELQKAGRSVWVDRARRVTKRARAHRAEVRVPVQQRREAGQVPARSGEITR